MLQLIDPKNATQSKSELLEIALRQVTGISHTTWHDIPRHLHPSFEKYMDREVWTGGPDLFTLSEAALMLVRDAIMRTGDFAECEG
jgi:hypothetical protein